MVNYYFYGRVQGRNPGYKHINRNYSDNTRDNYFSKVVIYPENAGNDEADPPEMIYYFNINAQGRDAVGTMHRCTVIGRTTRNNLSTSPMTGERETSFAHEYILDGAEHEKVMNDPDWIFRLKPFCTRVEDVFEEVETFGGVKDVEYVFPEPQDIWTGTHSDFTLKELMEVFGLTREDLRLLIYSFFQRERRSYIMLPENSRKGTGFALALMRRLLRALPAPVLENTGFLTYGTSMDSFYLVQTSHVFLTVSEVNLQKASEGAGDRMCFGGGLHPSVTIPSDMEPLIDEVLLFVENGRPTPILARFYEMLARDVNLEETVPPSGAEIGALWTLCNQMDMLDRQEMVPQSDNEVWANLNTILSRPSVWTTNIAKDLEDFLRLYISDETIKPENEDKLLYVYSRLTGLQEDIEGYFAHKVTNEDTLQSCLDELQGEPELQRNVRERIYNAPEWADVVAETEGRIIDAEMDSAEDIAGGIELLTDHFRQIIETNPRLMSNPGMSLACRRTLERLFLSEGERDLEADRGAMQTFVAESYQLGLGDEYRSGAAGVFARYLDRNSEQILEACGDSTYLDGWPPILSSISREVRAKIASLKGVLDSKAERRMLIGDFRHVVDSGKLLKVRNYLQGSDNEENIRALKQNPEDCHEIVRRVLNLMKDYDKAKEKRAEKVKLFDQMIRLLCDKFPEETGQILRSVMEAPLGGLEPLEPLYKAMKKNAASDEEVEYIRDQFGDAISYYYRHYKANFFEKRTVKSKEKFLSDIGLRVQALLK